MNTYFGLVNQLFPFKECALTIGNFDGVHSGHVQIFEKLRQEAEKKNIPTVLLTFEPHPHEYFSAHNQSKPEVIRLCPLEDKISLIEQSGYIDFVIVVTFNQEFANIHAKDFIELILKKKLHTKYLLIGDDFKFGFKREGSFKLLQTEQTFITEQTPSFLINHTRTSSSVIRQELFKGNFNFAEQMLGHEYFLSGTVVHGEKLGREIGCPTANIHLPPLKYALSGIYVVEVEGSFGRKRGVANLGTNPTVSDGQQLKLEVHIFDLKQDLYGQKLNVIFKHKLRDEEKYNDLESLKKQIFIDMEKALTWQKD